MLAPEIEIAAGSRTWKVDDAPPTGDAAHAQRRGVSAEAVREEFDGEGSRATDCGAEGGDRVGELVLKRGCLKMR